MIKHMKLVLRDGRGRKRQRARSRKVGHVLGRSVSVHRMGIYSAHLVPDKPAWVSR